MKPMGSAEAVREEWGVQEAERVRREMRQLLDRAIPQTRSGSTPMRPGPVGLRKGETPCASTRDPEVRIAASQHGSLIEDAQAQCQPSTPIMNDPPVALSCQIGSLAPASRPT